MYRSLKKSGINYDISDFLKLSKYNSLSYSIEKLKSLKWKDSDQIRLISDILHVDIDNYLISKKPYLTSQQVKFLYDSGFALGVHSHSHIEFNHASIAEVKTEIEISLDFVKRITGQSIVPFAIPFGRRDLAVQKLKKIFLDIKGIDSIFDLGIFDDNFTIGRFPVDDPSTETGRSNLEYKKFHI